jgi:hypothetical protein
MPEGEDLRFELQTRPNAGPEGGEQGDEQRWRADRRSAKPLILGTSEVRYTPRVRCVSAEPMD